MAGTPTARAPEACDPLHLGHTGGLSVVWVYCAGQIMPAAFRDAILHQETEMNLPPQFIWPV